ncbi:hypothetical protein [Actinacidiphila rubida]|uniref:Uncharacterized protein n=1 Tax=Actinacidiphila rubida TaxID=310780 RepID=A0A1H8TTA6_9ACTN|nr:hypothetical protein [Actinacidiphila rubida]SEO94127.1 hypothetical protein SAMN05216267_105813 [Actinacidiphila rubida]
MCQRAICNKCQKFTYRGCGMHVEQVLTGVPTSQRCTCTRDTTSAGSRWKRLLGRS